MGSGPMQMLAEELRQSGKNPEEQALAFVNVYIGINDLRTEKDRPWWICFPRNYGFLTVLLHRVPHQSIIATSIPELGESLGLCITLMWTTQGNYTDELEDALHQADTLIKQVEMMFGIPLPIPLKKRQLPDRFAIAVIDPTKDDANTFHIFPLVPPDDHGIQIDEVASVRLGQLTEALGPIDEVMDTPLKRALYVSSKWQRQAIHASGLEEWSDVVVASNTWIETFLVQLAKLMNEAANTPIEDIQSAVMKGGLPRFINTYLGQRYLKGRWDHTCLETEFGAWYEKCFKTRNAVVHSGYFANESDAKEAYEAAHKLAHFVTARAAKVDGEQFRELLQPLRAMAQARLQRFSASDEDPHP